MSLLKPHVICRESETNTISIVYNIQIMSNRNSKFSLILIGGRGQLEGSVIGNI